MFNNPMMHPGMAMFGQGVNNIMAMRRGGMPQQSPMQAYQNAVLQQAMQEKQMAAMQQQQQLNALRMQSQQQQLNPFYDFETARERGYVPQEMTLAEFQQMNLRPESSTSVIKNFQAWSQLNPNATPEQQRAAFDNLARAPQIVPTGGGGQMAYSPVSGPRQIVDPAQATAAEAGLAGAERQAETDVDVNQRQLNDALDQTWALKDAYGVANRMSEISDQYLQMLETGAVDTGLAQSFMLNTFGVGTEELAAMNAEAVNSVLENLQITNLAPVTVQELRTVAGLWADIARQPEPNMGVLKRAIERSKAVMERVQGEAIMQADRVREYGGDARFESLLRANPFIRNIYPQAGATGGADDDTIEIPGLD